MHVLGVDIALYGLYVTAVSLALTVLRPLAWAVALAALLTALVALLVVAIFPNPTLVTVPYSHYCELARWALDARGIAYAELKLPLGVHAPLVVLVRLLFAPWAVGDATAAAAAAPGSDDDAPPPWCPSLLERLRRLAAVPCAVDAAGALHPSSWAVLARLGRLRLDAAWRARLDAELGPAVHLLVHHHATTAAGVFRQLQGCGALEMALFDALERLGGTSALTRRWLGCDDAAAVAHAVGRVRACVDEASAVLLADPFLGRGDGGEAFGAADLAFCALVAPLLAPPEYGHASYGHGAFSRVLKLDELPAEVAALADELRASRAGKHVLRCYAELRGARLAD